MANTTETPKEAVKTKFWHNWKPQNWPYQVVDWVVQNSEDMLIRATPLLSPLPSAFATVRALTHGGWVNPWLMGFVVEGMGLCSGALMGYIETHNQKYPNQRVNVNWGRGLFGFYVFLVIAIIGGYETIPNVIFWWNGKLDGGSVIKSFVPLLFPGLTLVGSVIVALRGHMKRTESRFEAQEEVQQVKDKVLFDLEVDARKFELYTQQENARIELQSKRDQADLLLRTQEAEAHQKLELAKLKVETKLSTPRVKSGVNKVSTVDSGVDTSVNELDTAVHHRLLEVYRKDPKTSLRSAGEKVGRSHTWVDNELDKMAAQGLVERRNGDGVKVING